MTFSRYIFFFRKGSLYMFDRVLTAPLILSIASRYFCMIIIKTFRFLFLLALQSMNWLQHLFIYTLWVVYQTVQDIVLIFLTVFLLLAKSVLPSYQHLFLYIIFICKNITVNDSCISFFVGFLESFFISWNNNVC